MTKQIEQLDADRLIDPTRRKLLLGSAGAVGLAGFLGGGIWSVSAEALAEDLPPNTLLGFRGIAASTADEVTIAPGYRAEVLISWGEPLVDGAPAFDPQGNNSAADQEKQFGDNNDGMSFFPIDDRHGVMAINNEYVNEQYLFAHGGTKATSLEEVRKSQAAHGVSIVAVKRVGDGQRGGRAMEIVYDETDLRRYFQTAVSVSNDAPVLLDRFLDDAVEVDVDAICDGERVLIGGIMEHIEQAGVHSGDSACSLPAYTLSQEIQDVMRRQVEKLAFELQVRGLMNVQFAVKDNEVYLIEVNPRAARTVPFVSKATGVPLAKVAARVMAGKTLVEQGVTEEIIPPYYSVKEVVLPFNKFPGVDPILGPEMRSTGEVMGVGRTFAEAFSKAMLGSNSGMKKQGRALLSVREGDKARVVDLAASLLKQGFELDATHGTAVVLGEAGINPRLVNKVHEGRPHIQDRIKNGEYTYIVNTTAGRQAIEDSKLIRRSALQYKVHYDTTLNGGFATAMALKADPTEQVTSVQEMHARIGK